MDARFIVEAVRWCMNETLRVFWNHEREIVAKAIRELLHFDVACIGKYQNVLLVRRTDLKAEEEILVLLHYAGEAGFSRRELGQHARCSPASITLALQALTSQQSRQAIANRDCRANFVEYLFRGTAEYGILGWGDILFFGNPCSNRCFNCN